MKIERLYNAPEAVENFTVLHSILEYAAENYPDKIAYRQIENKTTETSITFARLRENVEALRASLLENGFKGKHIAILGETSIEWITVYLAVTAGIGVCVPIDKELPPETIATQLETSDADFVFCSARCVRKLGKTLPDCKLSSVGIMRSDTVTEIPGADEIKYLSSFIEDGKKLLSQKGQGALPQNIDPDDTCVIIFTSGTTGANKGVMLSNRNIMGTLRGCARLLMFTDTSISVLPVNHSYELHAHLMSCLYCGTTVCINDDLKHLLKNLERFAPEMSCMVPMMLDLIVKKLKKGIEDARKQEEFEKGVKISKTLLKFGVDIRKKLFAEILAPLGGNLKMIICGGAALSQDTVDFLENVGITVYNGYGITECSPVAAVNMFAKRKKNSVGHLLPTMKVRIDSPDEEGNGEIQLYGENVMQGYYKAEEDTKKVFTDDGWFRTGDIGHVDKDKFLYISGRLKNLIILPNGKNVYPEEIEEHMKSHIPYIKECVVCEDKDKNGIYSVIFPDLEYFREKSAETPEVIKALILKDIDKFNSLMPGYKRIADFEITMTEFVKNTTHKIQRFKIAAVNKEKK